MTFLNAGGMTVDAGTYWDLGTSSGTAARNINATSGVAYSSRLRSMSSDLAEGYNLDLETISSDMDNDFVAAMRNYNSAYEDMKNSSESYSYNLNDAQVYSRMATAYARANGGETVAQAISKNTKGSFVTGLLEGIPLVGWLFANPYSKAEATEVVTGRKASVMDKVKEGLGAATSTAATLGVLGAASGLVSSVPVIGGIAAAVAGSTLLPVLGIAAVVGAAVVCGKQLLANGKV
ncbi:hypothetical protein IJ670_06535 [bacterium]|nr:hypothetical protein [bacterium]